MEAAKIAELEQFVNECKSNPSLLDNPSLDFFRSYLQSLGAQIPPEPKTKKELQHFCHVKHPLVFNEHERKGDPCYGCREPVFGPSYHCIQCKNFHHHKSCAELPFELHHPLHPKHPLILIDEWRYRNNNAFSKCKVCKEYRGEYTYCCSRCDFNLHIGCAVLLHKGEVHDHPLTPICKLLTFTCDLCGKEGKGVPYMCFLCGFWTHKRCAYFLHKVKVIRHNHPLNLIHSLEVLKSETQFCQLCVQKVDIHYGLYYCSSCDFISHLDCAWEKGNMDDIKFLELKDEESTESKTMLKNEDTKLDQSVNSEAYKVKKTKVGEDRTEIAIEIKHFSHNHVLKLTYEVQNNKKCNGCLRDIIPPFYSCAKCSFFLHKSCVELPREKRHPLHRHPLTLLLKERGLYWCRACNYPFNIGFSYSCEECKFRLHVQCSLVSNTLTHKSHKHQFFLSNTSYRQSCSSCGSKEFRVFRCPTCEFALDFKCATLPLTTRYKQHEHPFTLYCTPEDDSGEYYCDICEEERDPKHWFYYCEDCNYPAHLQCILGKYPDCNFRGTHKYPWHPHSVTLIKEMKDPPPCNECHEPCEELIFQCTQCNFNIHGRGDCRDNLENRL